MQEIHTHRGFIITVVAEDDPAGGSSVTTCIQPNGRYRNDEWIAPRRARSRYRGAVAIGAAFDDARRAIDAALGSPDPIED